MPGLVAFGRRWSIGSDDLLVPSFTLFSVHLIWIIVIIVAIILDYGEQSAWPKEVCKVQSLGLLVSILVLVLFSAVLEICLTVISLRGSILNDTPRSGVPYFLYVRLFALILEIIWSVIAFLWSKKYFTTCDHVLTKQAIIGLIVWVWFVLMTVLITIWCVFDAAGRSWVKMKRYQANVKENEHRHPSFRRSGSTQRNWRQRKVMRQYESSWNNRCRFLFCCVHSESNRDSFGDLSKLLSEFFRDLDVVPSDIIVGLLLLRKLQRLEQVTIINEKRNNTYEFLSGIAITPHTKFVAMNDAHDFEAYQNVVYYMRYASAAYGWLWYVIPNGFRGLFSLCSNVKCCIHRNICGSLGNELSETVVEDNCCFCNVAVIPTMFDPSSFEIVYATYHVDVGQTPFFVVVDYEKKAVVISIRGTLSLNDLLTDLNAEAEPLPLNPARDDWTGHKGMIQVATYLKSKLVGEHILDRAFEMCRAKSNEEFNIVIVGHSLGGGAAAILAILLREQLPNLVCYAYSPPGGLLSMPAVEYTKEFVTSVIVGKDLVPRIGLSQMEALRADLLNAIKKSHTSKWKTIMSGMKCCKCIGKLDEFASSEDGGSSTAAGGNECSSASQKSFQEDLLSPNDSAVSMTMHQPLFPPGRIMHVVRHHPKKDEIKYESIWRRLMGKGEPVFQAIWTENTDYDEVLISPGMIQDHMPDKVLKALNRVSTTLGPAKPQRMNASPMNPMNEHSSCGGDILEISSKIQSEASFASEAAQSAPCLRNWAPDPPPITVTTGMEGVVAVDAVIEEGDEYVSLAGSGLSSETLPSLKLNWDLFKELGKHPLKFNKSSHTRNSSSGSSNCSELGTTMKEIFGPLKSVPLASSETLSEISSMSSRASFIIRDRSPMAKLKLGKNFSLKLHDTHGDREGVNYMNGNGKSHQRSYSCVYPEGKKVSNGLLNQYGTLNGGARISPPDGINGNGSTGSENRGNNVNNNGGGYDEDLVYDRQEGASFPSTGVIDEEKTNEAREDVEEDPDQTPTGVPVHSFHEMEYLRNNGQEAEECEEGRFDEENVDMELNIPEDDLFTPSEIEHLVSRIGERDEDQGPSSAMSTREDETGDPLEQRPYSPVYPVFATQDEYGTSNGHKSPHYHYPNPSPLGSLSSVHSKNGNNGSAYYE